MFLRKYTRALMLAVAAILAVQAVAVKALYKKSLETEKRLIDGKVVFDTYKLIDIVGNCSSLFNVIKKPKYWPIWDTDLEKVEVLSNSTTLEGTTGTLKMKNGKIFDFVIRDVIPNNQIAYRTELIKAYSDWYWEFHPIGNDEIVLKMGVKVGGPAAYLWTKSLINFLGLEEAFDKCMRNLKSLIETGFVDDKNYSWLLEP